MTQFVSHSPWYVYLFCFVAALGLSAFLYYRNSSNKEVPRPLLLILLASRFFSILLVLLLLCHFFIKSIQRQYERPLLILAIDNSSSMLNHSDSNQVKALVNKQLVELQTGLEETFEISTLLFGSEVRKAPTANFEDKESDLEALFQEMESLYANRHVGATVLVSDGIQNKGAAPLQAAERSGFPVYSIGVGDTAEFRDIKISKISNNQIAYLGNAFPVDVFIQASQLKGKSVVVKLMQGAVEKAKSNLLIPGDQYAGTLSFTLNAEALGINVYKAKIEVLTEEKNALNNSQEFVVEVQDKRQKILLLVQAPHPDIGALKESLLSNASYELETRFTESFSGVFNPYNLVLFHGLSSQQKPLIERCLEQAVPFWLIAPASGDVFPGLRINGNGNRFNDTEPLFNKSFGLFTVSRDLQNFMENSPAVKSAYGKTLLSNGASPILYQKINGVETTEPLFVFNESSGSKTACFIGDGLWKWKMRDFSEHGQHQLFNELVFATVHYLSVKNDKSQFRLRYPKVINENEDLEMEADVYNKSYEPIHNAEVNVVLRNSNKKTFNYSFSSNSRYYQAFLGQLPPDEYEFTATSKAGEEVLQKTGKLLVREMNAESMNPVANHRLLQQLSKRSGGKFYSLDSSQALINDLLGEKKIKSIAYSVSSLNRLLDYPFVFFVLLSALVLEWAIRKRYLSI